MSLIRSRRIPVHCLKYKRLQGPNSGKTHTLRAIARALNATPKKSLYTAFQKAVITEGQEKLSDLVECKTLHALAYRYVYPLFKTEIQGNLNMGMLPSTIPQKDRLEVIQAVEKFFTSDSVTLDYFDNLKPSHAMLAHEIVDGIIDGKYPITFNFLLKYFHLSILDGTIKPPSYDLLMLDEAGDTTGVILEIFKLIPAKKKVMAGDPQQNIYTFMHTINGFEHLSNDGTLLSLSKSFRVNKTIAKEIEHFVQANLDAKMKFEGVETPGSPQNIAFIASTNATLIARMFTLTRADKNFQLLRQAKEIFSLPLALITASSGKELLVKKYKYLEKDYKAYTKDKAAQDNTTFLGYLKYIYPYDVALSSAISLLTKHSFGEIFKLYGIVKNKHLNTSHRVLTTCHTAKG